MNKILKYVLHTVLGIGVVLITVVLYIVAIFNPNDYIFARTPSTAPSASAAMHRHQFPRCWVKLALVRSHHCSMWL